MPKGIKFTRATRAVFISADEIKKQMKGYNPEMAERFHRESARQADKRLERMLKEEKVERVVLMNGGAASGKTEFLSEYLYDKDFIIFDGTLSSENGAEIKIKKIIKAKKTPVIYSVIPDDLSRAFVAFLHRDRKFTDKHFYRTHSGARKTLLWIAKNYPKIRVKIFESSYSKKQDMIFKEITFSARKKRIEFLENIQYNEDEIIKIVINHYEEKDIKKKKSK